MRPNRADSCPLCQGWRRVVLCARGEAELAACLFPGVRVLELERRPEGGIAPAPCPGPCGTAAAVAAEHNVAAPA